MYSMPRVWPPEYIAFTPRDEIRPFNFIQLTIQSHHSCFLQLVNVSCPLRLCRSHPRPTKSPTACPSKTVTGSKEPDQTYINISQSSDRLSLPLRPERSPQFSNLLTPHRTTLDVMADLGTPRKKDWADDDSDSDGDGGLDKGFASPTAPAKAVDEKEGLSVKGACESRVSSATITESFDGYTSCEKVGGSGIHVHLQFLSYSLISQHDFPLVDLAVSLVASLIRLTSASSSPPPATKDYPPIASLASRISGLSTDAPPFVPSSSTPSTTSTPTSTSTPNTQSRPKANTDNPLFGRALAGVKSDRSTPTQPAPAQSSTSTPSTPQTVDTTEKKAGKELLPELPKDGNKGMMNIMDADGDGEFSREWLDTAA